MDRTVLLPIHGQRRFQQRVPGDGCFAHFPDFATLVYVATSQKNYQHLIDHLLRTNALRCLKCDYDLRGQEGDVRRCPECGTSNDIGEIALVVYERDKDIRPKLDLAFAFSILPSLLLFAGLGIVVTIQFVLGGVGFPYVRAAAIIVGSWIAGAGIAGAAARFKSGWLAAYCCYSANMYLFLITIAGGVSLLVFAVWSKVPPLVLIVLAFGIGFFPWSRVPFPEWMGIRRTLSQRGRAYLLGIQRRNISKITGSVNRVNPDQ